jgi:hypothetical protein
MSSPSSNASSVFEDEYLTSPPASFKMDMEDLPESENENESEKVSPASNSSSIQGSPKIKLQRRNRSVNTSVRRLSISKGKLEKVDPGSWQKDFTTIGKFILKRIWLLKN